MSSKLTLLALFLASLTTSLPIGLTSQNITTHPLNSVAPNISAHTLAKRTTANPPFDPHSFNSGGHRVDGNLEGDVFRLTKCFCVDTPSRDLPPPYGQYFGSYYGFDYYNGHLDKSYAFSWTCASGELESMDGNYQQRIGSGQQYMLGPKCLAWMEEEIKQCWDTGDGNEFCAQVYKGKDYYFWNGQKRMVHNHPSAPGTTKMPAPQLNKECQRLCQTVPANTEGWMQDNIPSDHEHKVNLGTATTCTGHEGTPIDWMCRMPSLKPTPKVWETWNYIETYSDQADMCTGCA